MSKRSDSAILGLFERASFPVIVALADFAAQNSGIDYRNYYSTWADKDGIRAYRADSREISKAWGEFKRFLQVAAADGVTDAHVIEAGQRAFSGRLTWKIEPAKIHRKTAKGGEVVTAETRGRWDYCTGQYFPTEYRRAACAVLDEAIRAVRRSRPERRRVVTTIAELKELNAENGGCWFKPGEMRFFGTRIESGIVAGHYFVTSELAPHGPRKYSVRSFDESGSIDTVGEFNSHRSKADAKAALREHVKSLAAATA